jgi:cytochrome c553
MYRTGLLALFCLTTLDSHRIATAGPGNAADGENKSVACLACHISLNPETQVPHLVGQRAPYLVKQLKAFKSGDRKDSLMSAVASQLSDTDIENLAAYWSQRAAGSDTAIPAAALPIRNSKMTFPRAFPRGFVVYDSSYNAEDHSVSKSFANTVAIAAARAGQPLPDGSAIVVAAYSAKLDAKKQPVRDPDGGYAVDKTLSYSAMEARAGWGKDIPELLRNANWNYGLFNADKTPRGEWNQAVCLACHKPIASDSYLFSFKALKTKAQSK